MADEELPEIVVSKEDAVFWMDRFGRWHNEHGPFEHKKIIDYFNSSIRKDDQGYFVGQIRDDIYEKVYFRYEETPLIVMDVVIDDSIVLILNTKEHLELIAEHLFVRGDNLYVSRAEETIRFTDRVLLKLVSHIGMDGDNYYFEIENTRTNIPVCD